MPELAKNQLSMVREARGDIGMDKTESKERTKEKNALKQRNKKTIQNTRMSTFQVNDRINDDKGG